MTPAEELTAAAAVLEQLPSLLVAGRARRQLSLRATAETTGISFNTLSRVERGVGQPTLTNILGIVRWLALDPEVSP